MIGRKNRFHGRAGIQWLYRSGKVVRSGPLGLRYVVNSRRDRYRLAVVVSRKVSKSAVVRNRIRRRLYEHVRILSGSFSGPYDLSLMVYDSSIADMPVDVLATEVTKLFKKARLMRSGGAQRAIVEPKERSER